MSEGAGRERGFEAGSVEAARHTYGDAHRTACDGAPIAFVEPDSPAEDAGLEPGDVIVAVDCAPVRDVLDWQWAASDFEVGLTVRAENGTLHEITLERDAEEGFGIGFDDVVFDGVRECDNACLFCFVSQLPPGLRDALYVKDDDYRLSFLYGNFVTLTNLTEEDVERIATQRLTPLYVSLHAVDAAVRRRLVCVTTEDTTVERLDELLAAGIGFHIQIVLVPGVNDGAVLDETLAWLAERPGILSVGIVPLGFTSHQSRFERSYGDAEDSAALLDTIAPIQSVMAEERGERWVYAADEFYLAAGRPLPAWDDYDGFPQYENGIGLVRAFVDELDEALTETAGGEGAPAIAPAGGTVPVVLLTGELFAPVLRGLAPKLAVLGVDAAVAPVPNRLFGGNVSVTGLLGGNDVAETVRADASRRAAAGEPPATYLLPDVVVNSDGLLLDDVLAEELPRLAGARVELAPPDAPGLVEALRRVATEERR